RAPVTTAASASNAPRHGSRAVTRRRNTVSTNGLPDTDAGQRPSGTVGDVEIRGFTEQDRTELTKLAVLAGSGSPTESLWGHPESEAAIYLTPYLDREPESVFVSLDDDGALTGYLVGAVDSARFPSEEERM